MKLAIVTPWFGRDLKGGAEQQAWQIAARLANRHHAVEVLTTCCRSHQDDWATNHLPEGRLIEPEGFAVRRFPVENRKKEEFDAICGRLMNIPAAALIPGVSPASETESDVFVNELIRSRELQTFLHQHRTDYDAFILLPYLYGPIIHGVSAVADRACLQPCLHDEAYAYLREIADTFYTAKSLLFLSAGEAELAARLYGPGVAAKSIVVGAGVEVEDGNRTRCDSLRERFVLYLGRKDPGKNTDLLVRAFARFRRVRPNSTLRLVLAGHGKVEPNGAAAWIDDRGLITDDEKTALLSECLALVQPSRNESFSRTMMEAWRHGKPVAVNRSCLATATEVKLTSGGWLADSEEEWAAWFVEVDRATPDQLQQLGCRGKKHADALTDWNIVIDRYEQALASVATAGSPRPVSSLRRDVTINQFLPNLSYGDAISNHALWIRNELRKLGYDSNIYVRFIDPRAARECDLFSPAALNSSDAAIYHHSIGSEITPLVIAYAGPKCLIYHNITPAEFVEPYRPEFAEILRQGRRDLGKLAAEFDLSYGDSSYNAKELAACGFSNPGVLPIAVDPRKWNLPPDCRLMCELSDGRTNIIFVGRIAPNKRQDDLLRAFACYRLLDPTARLFLVGTVEQCDPYADHLLAQIGQLGLSESVRVTGNISEAELAAYYRTAHLFWSMSEHEGFLVPVVEAMWFDVPVLAFHSTAVPETLGIAALTFHDKSRVQEVAGIAHLLVRDNDVRRLLIAAQRVQRAAFLPPSILPSLCQLATKLAGRTAANPK